MTQSNSAADSGNGARGLWSSKFAFILAATGSAVGLGNIWKFPYVTGENGGGAFVLVYLLCIAIIGIPIMMAEVFIGRNGRHNPITSFRLVAERNLASPAWRVSAIVGMLAAFIILSFYSVIGGWAAPTLATRPWAISPVVLQNLWASCSVACWAARFSCWPGTRCSWRWWCWWFPGA